MKKIIEITDKHVYEDFIESTPKTGSFLQSWDWGEFQKKYNKTPYRYGLIDENNKIYTVGQFFLIKIPKFNGFYLYCPFGPIGERLQTFTSLLDHKFKSDFKKIWFVRYEPVKEIGHPGVKTTRIQPGKTMITDLSKAEDELKKLMHTKTRYNIKVADKHGVEIILKNSDEITEANIDAVVKLLQKTESKQGFKNHPEQYFRDILKLKSDKTKIKLGIAYHNESVTAVAIFVDLSTRTYLFGGSDNSHRHVMSPYALHWYAIKDAKNNKLESYDWWGVETSAGKHAGFIDFKMKWNGNIVQHPIAIDTSTKLPHYLLYKLARNLNRLF